MRTQQGIRKTFGGIVAAALAMTMLTGCDMFHDDLLDCATRPKVKTDVDFVYEYNTKAQDIFNEHVGAVTLYVFDSKGALVHEEEQVRGNRSGNMAVTLDLEPGTYTTYAIAQAHPHGYLSSLNGRGAKFRRNTEGQNPLGTAILNLDHNNGLVSHQGVMLDTLFTTYAAQELVVPEVKDPVEGDVQQPDIDVHATIPLMRVTNHLEVTFWQTDFPTQINPDFYDIKIEFPQGNGALDMTGAPIGTQSTRYTAYKVTPVTKAVEGKQTACLKAEFGLSRLMVAHNARLIITNKLTGHVTTVNNLNSLLAKGREAYETFKWSEQEYLDREYEYSIEFGLDDEMPKWVQINVSILGWAKKVLNTEL